MNSPATLEAFWGFHAQSRLIFDVLLDRLERIGPAEFTVMKSQIKFIRKRPFAWVWVPGRYIRGRVAPLVLALSFESRDPSPRWKEIVEPARGRFIHHLELYAVDDVDAEVDEWLRLAWEAAG